MASFGSPAWSQAPLAQTQPTVATSDPQVLRELSREHPLLISLGEGFAGNWVNQTTTDAGPIQDVILGAQVRGTQTTTATTTLDIVPAPQAAAIQLLLNGTTLNRTVSQTPQAAIQSEGNYRFKLIKRIEFDGRQFRTWSPAAYLTIEQRHLGAQTPVANVPLLGPLSMNIALSEAERRRPIAEQIAAQRVTQCVAPQFNNRIDAELSRLNGLLTGPFHNRLTQLHLDPSRITARSTNERLYVALDFAPASFGLSSASSAQPVRISDASSRNDSIRAADARPLLPAPDIDTFSLPRPASQAPATTPVPMQELPPREMATLLLHESLIDDLAQRAEIAGKQIPDTLLLRLLQPSSADDPSQSATPQMFTLLFAKENPISISFSQGEAIVELRVGIRPVLGVEIPTQIMTLAVRPELAGNDLTLKADLRSIEPLVPDPQAETALPIEEILTQALQQRLEGKRFPAQWELAANGDTGPITLRLQHLDLNGGWLRAECTACRQDMGARPVEALPTQELSAPGPLSAPAP